MRRLGTLAITIAGLILLVGVPRFLLYSVQFIAYESSDAGWPLLVLVPAPAAAALGMALVLLAKRRALAARWFDDEPLGATLEPNALVHALVAIGGAVLLAVSAPVAAFGIVSAVTEWLAEAAAAETPLEGPSMLWFDLVQVGFALLYALLGYALVVKAGWVASRLWRSASGGNDDS